MSLIGRRVEHVKSGDVGVIVAHTPGRPGVVDVRWTGIVAEYTGDTIGGRVAVGDESREGVVGYAGVAGTVVLEPARTMEEFLGDTVREMYADTSGVVLEDPH